MRNKLLGIIALILSSLFGAATTEFFDDRIQIPIIEKPEIIKVCPDVTGRIIAYTDNEKFYCECIGPECPCVRTEEILSEIG